MSIGNNLSMGISRFILLSVAMHLSVLVALDYSMQPHFLFPTTLTVNLGESSHMTITHVHRNLTLSSPAFPESNSIDKRMNHSAQKISSSNASRTSTHKLTFPALTQARTVDRPADRVNASITQHPQALTPLQPVKPVIIKETNTVMDQTNVPESRKIDLTELTPKIESELRHALAPYFAYPLMARRNGWQGRVRVGLRVESDGHLSHLRIAHSSGYRLLDSAALSTLNSVDSIPSALDWLNGRHFDMVLSIDYRLTDNQG